MNKYAVSRAFSVMAIVATTHHPALATPQDYKNCAPVVDTWSVHSTLSNGDPDEADNAATITQTVNFKDGTICRDYTPEPN